MNTSFYKGFSKELIMLSDKQIMQQFDSEDVVLVDKKKAYNGFFTVNQYRLKHRMFNGNYTNELVRECFERGHAVGVLAYDPWQDTVVLVEQFRIGAYTNTKASAEESPWLVEIIAGIVEHGENQEDVAHREAFEEAGCQLLALDAIANVYTSPGGTSETTQLYCACVDSTDIEGIYGLEAEGEDIRVLVLPFYQLLNYLHEGRLNNASSMISVQWLMLNKEKIRQKWLKTLTQPIK
jgi:ADP-ribose pyrophosphatase